VSGPSPDRLVVFEDVSKFYGEVLGVNKVTLGIPAGITSLVGPNGSGKTTLMNLLTGLLRPTRGRIAVLGISPTIRSASSARSAIARSTTRSRGGSPGSSS